MKNTILGIAALSLLIIGASDVFASRYYYNENSIINKPRVDNNVQSHNSNNNLNKNTNRNANINSALANGGEAQSRADNNVNIGGDSFRFPVSSAFAPAAISFVPCGRTLGFAWQGVNGAASLGVPLPNNSDCEHDNDALFLFSQGFPKAGIRS